MLLLHYLTGINLFVEAASRAREITWGSGAYKCLRKEEKVVIVTACAIQPCQCQESLAGVASKGIRQIGGGGGGRGGGEVPGLSHDGSV